MNRIKQLRNERNMKQSELASMLHVSHAAFSGYETGKFEATVPTYVQLAEFFGVSLDYLLGRTDDRTPFAAPASNLYGMTELEKEHLAMFRSLNDDVQPSAMAMLRGLTSDPANVKPSVPEPADYEPPFAERLKILRKSAHLKQEQLADALGVDRSSIGKYETGTSGAKGEMLIRIARFFHVSTDYLLGLTDIENPGADTGTKDSLSESQSKLLQSFCKLSDEGQAVVLKMIRGLVLSGIYQSGQTQTEKDESNA